MILRALAAAIAALLLTPAVAHADTYPAMPDTVTGPHPVTKVVDGDTIHINNSGVRQTVRLIGIDTPETRHPRIGRECYGPQATQQARTILGGQSVYLETDPTQGVADRYDRTLAYVWTPGGKLFNLDMIAAGYGEEYTYNEPYKYQTLFQDAETAAQAAGRGMHDVCTT